MATFTLDWSETNLGGSAVTSYASGAILDFTDKPASATAALSLTANRGDSINVTIAEFSIETSGSSVMTFDYHTSSESAGQGDRLHIDVDGVAQATFKGTIAWTSHAGISIASAGTHTIRFRYEKDGGGLAGQDRVWVALLNITNTVTTNDSSGTVDTYDMEDGNIPSVCSTSTWTNSTSEPITGSRSLRSPASPADSGSYDLDITKPATSGYRTVGFDWKVSSEAGWDKLYVFPDSGAANVPASGHPTSPANPGWLEFSGTANGRYAVILPAASSTLRLRYAKDSSSASGSDAAWIDSLGMPATGGGSTPITGADTGAGADAKSALTAALTRADTGTSADAGALAAALAGSDNAAAADTAASTASVPGSETGAGADSSSLVVAITAGDTAAAADAVADLDTGATAKAGSDTAAGAEVTATAATTSATDAAAAADAASVTAARTAADAATATESATVTVILATSEAASAADLAALAAAVAAAELAATLEAASYVDPTLTIGPAPPGRTLTVPSETRVLVVGAENRTLVVPAENRTMEA